MSIKIKFIFLDNDNWMFFKKTHIIRAVEEREVEKMMSCGEESKGYSIYDCPNCGNRRFVPFTCKSRLCSSCGKKHADRWAIQVNMYMFNVIHRHMVFTLSDKLWPLMEEDRGSWKVLLDTVNQTMKQMIGRGAIPGMLCILHPFGKDLKFNPHAHVIVTEGGLTKQNQWINVNFFSYRKLRKIWQYNILTNLKKYFHDTPEISKLIDSLFKNHKNGFYVRAKDRIHIPYDLIKYIGRYVRHPAIAESRIVEYSSRDKEDKVVFYYENDKKEKVYVTMTVFEFIGALIKHVPPSNFKMVRWYGLYSRTKWKKVKNLMSIMGKYNVFREQYLKEKLNEVDVIRCKKCGTPMIKVGDSFRGEYV